MTTGPMTPAFEAGYGPLPADFDGWVQTPLSDLTGKVVFRAERTGSLSLSTNTPALVTFDSILEDPYSGWSAGSGSWTAPWSGWYAIRFTASAVNVSSGELRPMFIVAGTQDWVGGSSWTNASGLALACVDVPIAFIGGQDAATFRIYCAAAAGSFNVATTAGQRCQGEIMWIGN
jgi:hypothetical protein